MLRELNFKLDTGIKDRLNKITKWSSKIKNSLELSIDYFLMKRLTIKKSLKNKEDQKYEQLDKKAIETIHIKLFDLRDKILNLIEVIENGFSDIKSYINFHLKHDNIDQLKKNFALKSKEDFEILEKLVFLSKF